MSAWLGELIEADSIAVYEGRHFTGDAFAWLREKTSYTS
jgi:hypothetical protein